jgi:hypothetical protein
MRVQRTRSSPSALRSPLTRHPLGPLESCGARLARVPVLAILLVSFLGCWHASPAPYRPDAELRADLSTLPKQHVAEVALAPQGRAAGTVRVPAQLWPRLFSVLQTLDPAPYFAASEYEVVGEIEISGPKSEPGDLGYPRPALLCTLTIRLHSPTGRYVVEATSWKTHASFPYFGDAVLEWYSSALREGA